jgi:hypothetical protein
MTGSHPLAATVERASDAHDWLSIVLGQPSQPGWRRCSSVDNAAIAEWETTVAQGHRELFGRTHAMAAASYVLTWYADIASSVGALCFLLDRRVPRLDPGRLAFHRSQVGYPDTIAVLDPRFWCLPTDADADHPDATAVADEDALARMLRGQVRAHADQFLATYRPGARLPRRTLLGAFFDGLDCGFSPSRTGRVSPEEVIATARRVLPGATDEFTEASSYYLAADPTGRQHLARRRVSCCYYFKVGDDGACTSCPRTSDAERAVRLADLADQAERHEPTP